jgi:CBS domain-containing protein/CheY-like chemotaxis protein
LFLGYVKMSDELKRVLIVDDEEDLREILGHFVESEGYEVELAENGKVALEKILEEDFYFVLTDLDMPVMTGTQLIAELRKIRPLLPVGIISAKVTEFATELVSVAVTATVPKPFDPSDLKDALNSLAGVAGEVSGLHSSSKKVCVHEIIKSDVLTADPELSVLETIKLMAKNNVGAIIIKENKHSLGIFTERDLLNKCAENGSDCLASPVKDFMTKEMKTVTPDATLEEVESIMNTLRVRHIPVVEDDGEVHGMISIRDISKVRIELMTASLERKSEVIGHIKNQANK